MSTEGQQNTHLISRKWSLNIWFYKLFIIIECLPCAFVSMLLGFRNPWVYLPIRARLPRAIGFDIHSG